MKSQGRKSDHEGSKTHALFKPRKKFSSSGMPSYLSQLSAVEFHALLKENDRCMQGIRRASLGNQARLLFAQLPHPLRPDGVNCCEAVFSSWTVLMPYCQKDCSFLSVDMLGCVEEVVAWIFSQVTHDHPFFDQLSAIRKLLLEDEGYQDQKSLHVAFSRL